MKRLLVMQRQKLYDLLLEPKSAHADTRRREFIINTLLCGLGVLASLAVLIGLYNRFLGTADGGSGPLTATLIFWFSMIGLLLLSRYGYFKTASFIFILLLVATGAQIMVMWGYDLAIAQLVLLLATVIAGVLFTARSALLLMIGIVVLICTITLLQLQGVTHPQLYWQNNAPSFGDIIGYVFIVIVAGIVAWLSNRETDRSLKRARASEAALQQERDRLEEKVIQRTQELEDLQLQRLLEIQPFAEFGRIGANLVHEIANPLTAASLHVQELNKSEASKPLLQVQRNLVQLERYLLAARKQIKRQSDLREFNIGVEVRQVVRLLTNRSRKAGVSVQVAKIPSMKVYGDTVKFSQVIANLLANAIDAAELAADEDKRVAIVVTQAKQRAVIAITDFGKGIPADTIEHLFKPFYTTKSSERGGLGIGLALVKQYVTHDFKGSIAVSSDTINGTTFTVHIPVSNTVRTQ